MPNVDTGPASLKAFGRNACQGNRLFGKFGQDIIQFVLIAKETRRDLRQ